MTQSSSYRSYPIDGEAARQKACVWMKLLQKESVGSLSEPLFLLSKQSDQYSCDACCFKIFFVFNTVFKIIFLWLHVIFIIKKYLRYRDSIFYKVSTII